MSEPKAVRAVGPGSLGSGTYGKVLDEVDAPSQIRNR